MASQLENSVLVDELTCPVCMDVFRDPQLLPCGHNLCLMCLRRLKKQASHGRLSCPECRECHSTSIPLQKNYRLANIAEDFRRRGQAAEAGPNAGPSPVLCDYCVGDRAAAAKTCLKCEVSMCGEHLGPHLELPAFRDHPLSEPLSDLGKRRCPEHDEMFRYYCLSERAFVCNACTIEGKHTGHTIKTLKNTMKDMKGLLDTQLQRTNKRITRAEKTKQEYQKEEQKNQTFIEETEQRANDLGKLLRDKMDVLLADLKECVRTHYMMSDPEQQQSRIKGDQARLQEVHSGIETLLKENDPFTFIQKYSSTGKRLRRLLKKPLFIPDLMKLDEDSLLEAMDLKVEEFQIQFTQQMSEFISSVFQKHDEEEDEEEEEEYGEDDSGDEEEDEEDDEELEEEEVEEEQMRSEEESEEESEDELYVPEDEEEEGI